MSEVLEHYSMNLPALVSMIKRWRKKILIFLVVLSITSTSILYIMPNQYYSYASALPTNSSLTDKGYLFSEKLDALYSSLGSFSDLDRLYSTAILDTSYKYLIHRYHLISRYDIKAPNENIAVQKAILYMSDDLVKIEKTEQGLLRIHVTDKNADTAAAMANDLMNYVEQVNTSLQRDYNYNCLVKVNAQLQSMKDSNLTGTNREALEKIKSQFELSIQLQQPSLRIVEKATPCYKHISPKRLYSLISVMIIGLICAVLFIAIIESLRLNSKA